MMRRLLVRARDAARRDTQRIEDEVREHFSHFLSACHTAIRRDDLKQVMDDDLKRVAQMLAAQKGGDSGKTEEPQP